MSYLENNWMSFARSSASEDQSREVFETLAELPGMVDIARTVLSEYGDGTTARIFDAPLPADLSFWSFDNSTDGIFMSWRRSYSDSAFKEAIRKFEYSVHAVYMFFEDELNVGCHYRGDKIDVFGGLGGRVEPFTLQTQIAKMRQKRTLFDWGPSIEFNWKFEHGAFEPCFVDTATGCVLDASVLCSTKHEAIISCQKLQLLMDVNPTFIHGCERIGAEKIVDYAEFRKHFTSLHRVWGVELHGVYADGLDPICRPRNVPKDGWHFPLVQKGFGFRFESTDVQLNIVHKRDGSYLELITGRGPDALREWTKKFPKLRWEIWPGDPAERWDGDPTPINLAQLKPAPSLMFQTPLDREVPCFVEKRVLTLFLGLGMSWTESCKWTSEKMRFKRSETGYTREEQEHLSEIDRIEARFDEIAARYTEWDSIRFWWPNKGDAFYWKKRPLLKKVKTMPMKVQGKKKDIPVEFVESLKCPM